MVAGEMNFAPTSWVEAFEDGGKKSASLADATTKRVSINNVGV
jgi:hypothetical protein